MDQCRECHEWGTLEKTQVSDSPGGGADGVLDVASAVRPVVAVRPIREVSATGARARPTGAGEPDRVLGGGITPGVVVLLAGEPGVGKSTLLLDVATKAAAMACEYGDGPALYVVGEESALRMRLRTGRIGTLDPGLFLVAEAGLNALLGHMEAAGPPLLVVNSVQATTSTQAEGSAGGVTQVRAVVGAPIAVAKERDTLVLLVGYVTRDDGTVGPRVLEHLAGVVTQLEGDRYAHLRLLRAVKNHYGPTGEVGCSDLGERGTVRLADPSGLSLFAIRSEVLGTCVTVTLGGRRPMSVEVQTLVAPTNARSPRRTTSGVNHLYTAMVLAVLSTRLRVDTPSADVCIFTVGGVRAVEPTMGLAVAISVVSAACSLPTPAGLAAFGETGFTGEVRVTVGIQRRLAEASRLGLDQAIVLLAGSVELREVAGIRVLPVAHVGEAMGVAPPRG